MKQKADTDEHISSLGSARQYQLRSTDQMNGQKEGKEEKEGKEKDPVDIQDEDSHMPYSHTTLQN